MGPQGRGHATGAAGVRQVLHAPLVGHRLHLSPSQGAEEVHVGAQGKGGFVVAELSPDPAEAFPIGQLILGDKHQVGHPHGCEKGPVGPVLDLHGSVEPILLELHLPQVQLHVTALDRCLHRSSQGLKDHLRRSDGPFIGEAGHAAGTVAAHLPFGAVGVENPHFKVGPLDLLNHQDPVGADGAATAAEPAGQVR